MQLNGGSYFSQDDSYESGCTPRDQDRYDNINSPQNRKKRGRFFAIFGKSNAENIETEPSHFASSQDDSNQFSQFSQDFTERLGGLSMKASQDHINYSDDSRSMFSSDGGGNSYPFGSNSNSSVSNRASKFTPFSNMKAPLSQSKFSTNREVPLFSSSSVSAKRSEGVTSSNVRAESPQKQITIAAPIENPFTRDQDATTKDNKANRRKPIGTNLWIVAFKERPRYVTDFEHLHDLGVGTFSSVSCARRRLDGIVYAVKRIKRKINSENEGKLVVRESCAHAALAGCPNMIQYFGCWLDDGHLHIQTEYCDRGSMDCFVSGSGCGSGKVSVPPFYTTCESAYNPTSALRKSELLASAGGFNERDIPKDPRDPHTRDPRDSRDGDTRDDVYMDSADCQGQGQGQVFSSLPPPQRFSDLMQSLGEDSQNSDSYSCFSENNSVTDFNASSSTPNHFNDSESSKHKQKVMENQVESEHYAEDKGNEGTGGHERNGGNGGAVGASVGVGRMTEDLAWLVLQKLSDALHFMHKRGMAHLDLRPANVFMRRNNERSITNSQERTHTSVHGIHTKIQERNTIPPSEPDNSPRTVSDLLLCEAYILKLGDLGHACLCDDTNWIEGESRYCSRELIVTSDGQHLDLRQADMFSLGASVYEMCLARELGAGETSEWHSIRDGMLDETFSCTYSQSLVLLIKRLLHPTPALRPTAKEVSTLTLPHRSHTDRDALSQDPTSSPKPPSSSSSSSSSHSDHPSRPPDRPFAHIFPLTTFSPGLASSSNRNHANHAAKTKNDFDNSNSDDTVNTKTRQKLESEVLTLRAEVQRLRQA